jgi:hypothetical protein
MAITYLNSVNQLIFVMAKCGVLFEVRTKFLNVIYTSFGFKGLRDDWLLGYLTMSYRGICGLVLRAKYIEFKRGKYRFSCTLSTCLTYTT